MTLKTTKIEDEAKFVVVHSTTQPEEYQPLEKKRDLLPIRYFRVTVDSVTCLLGSSIHTTWICLTRQVFQEQATLPSDWLHLFGLQMSAAIDILRNSCPESVCSHSPDVKVPGDLNLT